MDGTGKLLQGFRARPGDDHKRSIQHTSYSYRVRNGYTKEAAWVPCVLTSVCADEGTDSSS